MSNAENRKTMDNTLNAEDKNSMIRSMLKDAAILFAITLIAGLIGLSAHQGAHRGTGREGEDRGAPGGVCGCGFLYGRGKF